VTEELATRLEKLFKWQEEERMHMQLTFCLNTEVELLSGWIVERTHRLGNYEYPEMKYMLDHRKFGTESWQLPSGGKPSTASHLSITLYGLRPDVVDFTMMPLSAETVEVTATCYIRLARTYFVDLLLEIDWTWPGVISEVVDRELRYRDSTSDTTAQPEPDASLRDAFVLEAGDGRSNRRTPTVKMQERAEVCKRIKDTHPEWSYDRVAMEAGEELGELLTGESVRNAYRAMREADPEHVEEWTWERSDRVR
jgi:hypothetical protein